MYTFYNPSNEQIQTFENLSQFYYAIAVDNCSINNRCNRHNTFRY